jgi:hypothetical protein
MSMASDSPKLGATDPQVLLQNLLARVPLYNPEWTNLSASDPGVTILQLFTDLAVQVSDLCNQVPEQNRRQFLSLLQVPLRPATAAQGFVCFKNEKGPLQVVSMAPGLQIRAGQTVFETLQGVELLPVEAQVFYKRILKGQERSETLAGIYPDGQFPVSVTRTVLYETAQLAAPAVSAPLPVVDLFHDCADNALWIALLARNGESRSEVVPLLANRMLNLGVMPATPGGSVTLSPQSTPLHRQSRRDPLTYQIFAGYFADGRPKLVSLRAGTHVDVGAQPAVVPLRLPEADAFGLPEPTRAGLPANPNAPPELADKKLAARLVGWLRLGLDPSVHGLTAQVVWTGINAVQINQQATASGEYLGRGTGEPNQTVTLLHTPVQAESLQVRVGGERWSQIGDLLDAPPEVPLRQTLTATATTGQTPYVYTVDPVTGTISFGDGLHGARPGKKEAITASYRYGGGAAGNVEIGSVSRAAALPPGVTVSNPLPTWGGTDAEAVDEAERSVPSYLRHRDRLVTADDFMEIVRRTPGVTVGRVDVLPSFHPDHPQQPSPGTVTVMVLPQTDPSDPEAPTPDDAFLATVRAYVDPRRLITTEVVVTGPTYQKLNVTVRFEPDPDESVATVQDAIAQALRQYLSPLTGGNGGTGWPLGRAVQVKELTSVVERVEGVAYVSDLQMSLGGESTLQSIPMNGLALPWLGSCQAIWGSADSGPKRSAGLLKGADMSDGAGDDGQDQPGLILMPVKNV